MYTIANLVYGINLSDAYNNPRSKIRKQLPNFNFDELFDDRDLVSIQYSGGGDSPCYIGVDLDELDECRDVFIEDLKLKPTDEQIKEFQEKLHKVLDKYPELGEFCQHARIGVFLTWGTS